MTHEKQYDVEAIEKIILTPYRHSLQARSNEIIITKFSTAFNHWLKIPQDKIDKIMEIARLQMNGMIIVDDIQDDSQMRRTIPSSPNVFGIPFSLNAGLHAVALGQQLAFKLHPMAGEIYCETILLMLRGQGADIYWRDNGIVASESEYIKMAEQKCGSIFVLILRLMQLFSDNKTYYEEIAKMLSVLYEIKDDYCNLVFPEGLEDKNNVQNLKGLSDSYFCEDFTDGKHTWPIIHALKTPEALTVISILRQRTHDKRLKQYLRSVLERVGSLEYTRRTFNKLHQEIKDKITRLGGNDYLLKVMESMITWDNHDPK